MKWKELYTYEKRRREELEVELRDRRRQLETDMEMAYEDYQAERLREELEQRRKELERLEAMKRDRVRPFGRSHLESHPSGPPMFDSEGPPPPIHAPDGRKPWAPPSFGGDERDGPFGRQPVTHGRDPSARYHEDDFRAAESGEHHRSSGGGGGRPKRDNSGPDVGKYVQSHRSNQPHHPPHHAEPLDPHQAGVQRSLTQVSIMSIKQCSLSSF